MFGVGRKGELIKDYLQVTQPARIGYYPPLFWIGCDFHVKTIKCKKGDDHNPSITIKLQFWEMAEGERILLNIYICCRNSHGALVFWDPTCALSPDRVPKCLKDVKNKAYQERMSYCLLSLSINPVRSCHGQPFKEASVWPWRNVREWERPSTTHANGLYKSLGNLLVKRRVLVPIKPRAVPFFFRF